MFGASADFGNYYTYFENVNEIMLPTEPATPQIPAGAESEPFVFALAYTSRNGEARKRYRIVNINYESFLAVVAGDGRVESLSAAGVFRVRRPRELGFA